MTSSSKKVKVLILILVRKNIFQGLAIPALGGVAQRSSGAAPKAEGLGFGV